ncbi:MAG TPA: adenylate kinase [Cryomorphaceae bacterium]|nr:adenylate kinase [Owenweeksia sp.]MBF97902.1 adenylate kinase [Owenweeksia sp.]HAD97225.1 adenylate kinase [Cryomorphaceae bacterium]HBF20046.1 adenylate kinase [Cryomorphaceae bacterium]|tara:strand:- start:69 stop:650 length:582 start_codon:yes stop_codon:yes gene_type:complete
MLNIVLFGPPGAGKGTQSQKLVEQFNLIHLSTGDLLRSEIKAGTQLGTEAKVLMDQGKLVPDEIVIGMIRNKLEANQDAAGFIFDGFPRTEKQAEALDDLLSEEGTSITMMLALEVNEAELIKRLLERGKDSGRADDQDEKVIRERLNVYQAQTAILKEYYKKQDKFEGVNGLGTIEEVFERLSNSITAAKQS